MKNIFLTAGFVLASALGLLAQDCATGYCPASLTAHHKAGTVAPITVDIAYGVVKTNLSGADKCWITRNLGATTQATALDDNTVASRGWYWQFNRKQGFKHDGTTRTPNTVWITPINENSDWVIANDPCRLLLGGTWRIPTYTEWAAVATSLPTVAGIYASVLKIHYNGFLMGADAQLSTGAYGYYYVATQGSSTIAGRLNLGGVVNVSASGDTKTLGHGLRCLRDL